MEKKQREEQGESLMEKITSLCKRRGFIYQGSEIYGGLGGTWDYGPLGLALKNNIKNLWWNRFVLSRDDMYGVDAAILMNQNVWKASGHVDTFADPLVEDVKTKKRYRADQIEEVVKYLKEKENIDISFEGNAQTPEHQIDVINQIIKEHKIKSPDGNALGEVKQFNMMFKTHVGPVEDETNITYLRPETAGGIFMNFKNIVDSFHPKLPFGIAQIGKAFRNEIAPGNFIFRLRELEQMEVEYFIYEKDWKEHFEAWKNEMWAWILEIGLNKDHVHELEVGDLDRAHYSKRTVDFEFDYPFGRKELYGLAYRTDFDLKSHQAATGLDLVYVEADGAKVVPHVIEPSLGLDRTILAILLDAYREDELGGEKRTYLAFSPKVAPVKAAIFPLLKNKPEIVAKAQQIYKELKKINPYIVFDDNGNIGKRYRRQDEIGTPFCITVDFDTIEKDNMGTIRDRDTGEQKRIAISEIAEAISVK